VVALIGGFTARTHGLQVRAASADGSGQAQLIAMRKRARIHGALPDPKRTLQRPKSRPLCCEQVNGRGKIPVRRPFGVRHEVTSSLESDRTAIRRDDSPDELRAMQLRIGLVFVQVPHYLAADFAGHNAGPAAEIPSTEFVELRCDPRLVLLVLQHDFGCAPPSIGRSLVLRFSAHADRWRDED
jgi:hypothetical protein